MLVKEIKNRKLPNMDMVGLSIHQVSDMSIMIEKGHITLANGVKLELIEDTIININSSEYPKIINIALTEKDGLYINEWELRDSMQSYISYQNGYFCDIASINLPANCTNLQNVEVNIAQLI